MRIIDVRTVLLTGPSSNDPWITFAKSTRSVGLVELVTDSGLTGLGETYAGYFATELVTPVVDYVAPILLAAETLDPRVLTERMRWCLGYTARVGVVPGILAAVEAALWDLQGKAEGVPVHELLGGAKHARLRGYATGGPSPWPPGAQARSLSGAGGDLRGAAIVVHVQDPLPPDHWTWTMPRTIVTPHISGSALSTYCRPRLWDLFCRNVERRLAGGPLLNVVSAADLALQS